MSLQAQFLQVIFTNGIDTKTDAKYVAENKLLGLENGVLTTTGAIGKRNGYVNFVQGALSFTKGATTITLDKIEALGTYKNQLVIFGEGYGASYSPSAALFNGIGDLPQVLVGSSQIVDNTSRQLQGDWDAVGNIAVYAWDQLGDVSGIRYSIVDLTDNTYIVSDAFVSSTTTPPKVIILENYAYIVYLDTPNLVYRRINLQNLRVLEAQQNFPSLPNTANIFDVCKIDLTSFGFVTHDSPTDINFGVFVGNVAVPVVTYTNGLTAFGTAISPPSCFSIFSDASRNLWVVYPNASIDLIEVFVVSSILAPILNPTGTSISSVGPGVNVNSITGCIDPTNPTKAYFVYEVGKYSTISITSVNTSTDRFISSAAHGLLTGMKVRLSFFSTITTTPALSATTDYFVRSTSATEFELFTTLHGALANVAGDRINITGTTGTVAAAATPQNLTNGESSRYWWSFYSLSASVEIDGTFSQGNDFFNQHLVSKAFAANDDVFFVGEYLSTEQSTYYLYSAKSGALQATMHQGQAQEVKTDPHHLPQAVNYKDTSWGVPLGVRSRLITFTQETRLWLQGLYLSTFTFNTRNQYFNEEFVNNMVVQSGMLQSYDGARLVEYGFNKYPEYIQAGQATATSGVGLANGTYRYAIVYEWTDAAGVRHQSAPGFSNEVVVTSGPKQVRLVYESLPLSMTKKLTPNVVIRIYRTTANGIIFYRISTLNPRFNNPQSFQSVTFADNEPDSDIIGNEVLYTTGGEFENVAPPSPKLIAVNKTRCFIVPSEYPTEIWYSKESIDGTEQPGFNPAFVKTLDLKGDEITALAVMDDKIIAFKENKIFFFSGDGPNNLGQQDTFTEPDLITSDVGCNEPTSVTNTSEGIYFKSAKGFYLLTRDLNLEYVGRDVEAFNDEAVTSSALVNDTNQVRFTLESGIALVYDYFQKQWMTFSNHSASDAVIYKSAYVFAKANSTSLFEETPGFYKDGNLNVKLKIETGWIKLNSLQGFQRVRRGIVVGNFRSEHKLKISIAYDYQDYYTDEIIWSADDLYDVTLYGSEALFGQDEFYGTNDDETTYQVRFHMPRQKCESVKFKFEDVVIGDSGPSMEINHLMLEVAIKDGVYRLNLDKTVG